MGWSRDTIKKVAVRTGYPVIEAWSGHNQGAMGTIYGPMLHHTGTSASTPGDYPTLRIVRDGRPGLENSLCMYGLGKSGTIYLINDKISWHAGAGSWNGVTDGNGHFAGIEAEGPGTWSAAQLDSYQKLVASILIEAGRDINWMPTHAQFALPKGRKTDPTGIDMNAFKAKVQQYLANPGLLGVEGGFLMALSDNEQREVLSYVREIRAWARGGDPNVDNFTLLWLQNNGTQEAILRLEQMLKGGNKDGKNNFHWVVEELTKAISAIPGAQVDPVKLAGAISFTPQEFAVSVADELDRRNRDGDPKTGATS